MKLRWRCWPIDSSRPCAQPRFDLQRFPDHIASLIRALFGACESNGFTSLLKGTFVARANLRDDAGGARFRIKAAVALLVLYAVMHLTVGGILHLLNPADAPAANAPGTMAEAVTTGEPPSLYGLDPSPATGSLRGPADDVRECRLGFLLDSDCLFD